MFWGRKPPEGEASGKSAPARKALAKKAPGKSPPERKGRRGKEDAAAIEAAQSRWPHTNAARAFTVALAGRAKSEKALDISRLDWAAHFAGEGTSTPRRVVQFWDKAPPEEIRTLLAQVERVCADTGYEHVVYDLAGARERIEAMGEATWLRHFDDAFHPSMQADIFRVLELYHHGGLYVDADMTLARPIPFAPPTVPLFAQWTGSTRANVANWFLCSPARHPLFARILERIEAQLDAAARDGDGKFVKTNLLKLTGPAIVARAVEDYLAQRPGVPAAAVMPVAWCHTFVEPARRFLANPPQYKREGLHWKREAQGD